MPLYDKNDLKLHFIHIPRTGGRYIERLFSENGFSILHGSHNLTYYDGIMSVHFHNPYYKMYPDYNERLEFCVVRNPFTKFISSINYLNTVYSEDNSSFFKDEKLFNDFIDMQMNYNSRHNNWFQYQHRFISEKTKIWKYENGFGFRFRLWLKFHFNIDLSIKKISKKNYNRTTYNPKTNITYYEPLKYKKWNFDNANLLKKYVKNRYKKDYEMFNYW